jgi:hypothetical protein
VIVGGMLLSPICSLLVIPTLARLFMPTVAEAPARHEPPAEEALIAGGPAGQATPAE